jgi:small ligand-binding sensory domain FIST
MVFSNIELMKKAYGSSNPDVVAKVAEEEGISLEEAKMSIDRSSADSERMIALVVAKDVAARNGSAKILVGGELVDKTVADIEAEIDASYDAFITSKVKPVNTPAERQIMINALITQGGNLELNDADTAIVDTYVNTGVVSGNGVTGSYGNMPKRDNLYKALKDHDASFNIGRVKPASTIFNAAMRSNIKFVDGKFI